MTGHHHSRVRRPLAVAWAFACLWLAAPASGSVEIGQVPSDLPPNVTCPAGDYLQPSVTGGTLYIAKQAGTITTWSTFSSGPGTYVFKVFRRTSDPDAFQVIARSDAGVLGAGLLTFPTSIAVRSGDMIGFHKTATGTSCAIPATGDSLLQAPSDLGDGASGAFAPIANRRLNLSANLVPSNEFHVTQLSKNRNHGTATMVVEVSNPGVFTLSGKGLKKRQVSKNVVGASSLTFQLAAGGGLKQKLSRRGSARIAVVLTFAPTGGDPSTQTIPLTLRMRRAAGAV